MKEQPTCGKGLAERSDLPARFSALAAALAENLEVHQQTLDLTDDNSRKEHEAYVTLAKSYRGVAADLRAVADRMAGYRDLPMGRHDMRALAGPRVREAFADFIERERDLAALLQTWIERDQAMLHQMTSAPANA